MTTHTESSRGKFFRNFIHSEVSGSIVLLIATIVALLWANSQWADSYFSLSHIKLGISLGSHVHTLSLQHWINDGLMVIFFFVVGLEVKREIVLGELSTFKKAILPVAAALGGMIVPALFYVAFNYDTDSVQGWGIPMATDIAFALGVLALFGKRVPLGLKVFLTALAIADDIGAVLVIAVFYTQQIIWQALLIAGLALAALVFLRQKGVQQVGVYLGLAIVVWLAVFASGVHATVAGILVAMIVPVRSRIHPQDFIKSTKFHLAELEQQNVSQESVIVNSAQFNSINELHRNCSQSLPPGLSLEQYFHPWQSFFILPLFALFNAGVTINGNIFDALSNPISIGIIAGLFLGKQLGIMSFSWLIIKGGYAELPSRTNWPQIFGASGLAAIGFTMSIFISDLAFDNPEMITNAKTGILVVSMVAGLWGYLILKKFLPKKP